MISGSRWHISLSTWLADYLYKPLGGNRGGLAFTCRNLMLTMILGGLWHGAAWNYVLWGTYHGGLLSVHRALRERFGTARDDPAKALLKIGGFGLLTLYGWLLFRARSFAQIAAYTATLFTGTGDLSFAGSRPGFRPPLGLSSWLFGKSLNTGREGTRDSIGRCPALLLVLPWRRWCFSRSWGQGSRTCAVHLLSVLIKPTKQQWRRAVAPWQRLVGQ